MQIDEVHSFEKIPSLGVDFVKFVLQDVLLAPKTGRMKGRRASSVNSGNGVDKSGESVIIEVGSEKMIISAIDFPIEQKHTGKGNPNAILIFDVELNSRQASLLKALPEYDSRVIVPKETVNMSDLSALTAKTGDEFAMFTKGNERLIIRGNSIKVNIDFAQANQMSQQGYKWSGHTHPGDTFLAMQPSDGDYSILECFKQEMSVIYNSKGEFRTFEKKGAC